MLATDGSGTVFSKFAIQARRLEAQTPYSSFVASITPPGQPFPVGYGMGWDEALRVRSVIGDRDREQFYWQWLPEFDPYSTSLVLN